MFANPFQCFGIVSQSKWQTKHNPIRNNSGRRIVFKGVRENITQSFEDIKIYIKNTGLKTEWVIKFLWPLEPPNKNGICFSMISGFLYIKSRIFFNPGIQLINNKAKSIKFIRAAKNSLE